MVEEIIVIVFIIIFLILLYLYHYFYIKLIEYKIGFLNRLLNGLFKFLTIDYMEKINDKEKQLKKSHKELIKYIENKKGS